MPQQLLMCCQDPYDWPHVNKVIRGVGERKEIKLKREPQRMNSLKRGWVEEGNRWSPANLLNLLWLCAFWLNLILINKMEYNEENQNIGWLIRHRVREKYLLFHFSLSQCLWMDNGGVIPQWRRQCACECAHTFMSVNICVMKHRKYKWNEIHIIKIEFKALFCPMLLYL